MRRGAVLTPIGPAPMSSLASGTALMYSRITDPS
jgi:hypothetical protein